MSTRTANRLPTLIMSVVYGTLILLGVVHYAAHLW